MSEKPEKITVREYHQRTKHSFQAYSRGPETIDWDAQPDSFRTFDGTQFFRLPLTADDYKLQFSALDNPNEIAVQPINTQNLGLLLEISLALSAWKQYGNTRWSLRCNPSSGNLHPTESYLILAGLDGIEAGVYHYRPDQHGLEMRCRFKAGSFDNPVLLVALTSVHWREAWKYGERAFRYCQHDVGHAVGALSYGSAALGWKVNPIYQMGDKTLAHLTGVARQTDFGSAEPECPDLLIAIQCDISDNLLDILVGLASEGVWFGQANVLDARHLYSWPIIDRVAESTRKPDLSASIYSTNNSNFFPPPIASAYQESATSLFRRRRSAQAFDNETTLPIKDFQRMLDQVLPRPEHPPWNVVPWQPRVHLILFIHNVESLKPGLYCLPRTTVGLEKLQSATREEFVWQKVEQTPDHIPLYLLIAANAQRTAAQVSCHQPIAGTGCFSLGMLAEFEENVENTPWVYRELFWEAGVIGQVLYLEAENCFMRGTGIGCYFDDPVHNLLGLEGLQFQSMYHFTVGGAITDSRIANLPPYQRQ